MRESKDEKRNQKTEIGKGDDNCPSISEVEPTTRASSSDDRRAGIVPKDFEDSSNVGNSLKETSSLTYKVLLSEHFLFVENCNGLENISYAFTIYSR